MLFSNSFKWTVALVLFTPLLTIAQIKQKECATPSNFPDQLRNLSSAALQRQQAGLTLMRMYVHICRDDNGTNQPMTQAAVENEIRITDSVYSLGGICFVLVGVDYINSTALNQSMMTTDVAATGTLVANCFNVYVVKDLDGYFGNAFAIPNNYIGIVPSGFGARRTFIHELGHDLGLFHTFHGQPGEAGTDTCAELVDNSNDSTCGDYVRDTPADPYSDSRTCNSVSSVCVWNGTCRDANNQVYAPNTHNYMSYWPNFGASCDRNHFTVGQFTRMQQTINTTTLLSNCIAPNSKSLSNATITTGRITEATRDILSAGNLSGGNYNLTNGVQAYLSSAQVVLKPGFLAQPTGTGEVRILPTVCQ